MYQPEAILEEVVSLERNDSDLFLKVTDYRIRNVPIGVRKIERKLREEPLVVKYTHYGQVFDRLDEAYQSYKQHGPRIDTTRAQTAKGVELRKLTRRRNAKSKPC